MPVVVAYPSGRHVIDVCVDDARRNLALETNVHPDGPDAHVARHLALTRLGWEFLEAYPSRWSERRAELIVNLLNAIRAQA